MPKGLQLKGMVFNMLTVLGKSAKQINGNVRWDCICECGNTTYVTGSHLKSGVTKSCGCLAKNNARGHSNPKHGMSGCSEYQAWSDAKSRCYDTNNAQFGYYGGRGIQVQENWIKDFSKFFEYIGPKPGTAYSLDRIDNDLDYCEGNVRWATKLEQVANRGRDINNKTGVTGVTFVINPTNGFKHYKAYWGPKSNKNIKSFSVSKYGEEVAFNMAVNARTNGLKKLQEESGYSEKHGEERKHK